MRSRDDMKGPRAAAADYARDWVPVERLLADVPGMNVRRLKYMLEMGEAVCRGDMVRASPGLWEPEHRPPPQALQVSSVWAYAQRFA